MFEQIFVFLLILVIVGLAILTGICLNRSFQMAVRSENEKYFLDPKNKTRQLFASLNDPFSKYLTVVIPAYKEVDRLPEMIKDTMDYLVERKANDNSFSYELIIVDDGSPDKTSELALTYSTQYGIDVVRVLTLDANRGKGGAVRMGVLSARGQWILFADADGATKFSDFSKVEQKALANIRNERVVICGSRRHLEKESVAKRSAFRTLLIQAARDIFSQMHVERWAFDVELLYIAEKLNIPIAEVDVNWQEIAGSKLDPFTASLQMGIDILSIWLHYILGIWTIRYRND